MHNINHVFPFPCVTTRRVRRHRHPGDSVNVVVCGLVVCLSSPKTLPSYYDLTRVCIFVGCFTCFVWWSGEVFVKFARSFFFFLLLLALSGNVCLHFSFSCPLFSSSFCRRFSFFPVCRFTTAIWTRITMTTWRTL